MKGRGILLSFALLTGFAIVIGDAGAVAQRRTAAFPPGTVVDLSYPFDSGSVYWPTAGAFHLEKGL